MSACEGLDLTRNITVNLIRNYYNNSNTIEKILQMIHVKYIGFVSKAICNSDAVINKQHRKRQYTINLQLRINNHFKSNPNLKKNETKQTPY